MTQKDKILSTTWNLVREAGANAAEAASNSKVGTSLVKAMPKAKKLGSAVKDMVSVGAGLAIAKRGGKAALAVARRNPIATAAGAVALAGIGVAVAVVRKRKARAAAAADGNPKPQRLTASNRRGNGAGAAKKVARAASGPVAKAPAKKAASKRAASATRKPRGTSTH